VTVTIAPATINVPSKTATQPIRACYLASGCDENSTWTLLLADGNSIASAGFITVAANKQSIVVTPTAPAHIGTWVIKATQATNSGPNPVYTAVTITVGCTITNIASPTAPTSPTYTLSYNIYDTALTIDLAAILFP